ncbi:unnamed protein product [Dovyalis caffra]|uniref:Uncharacterized protein n=1 Tax=Dovyalis caffra TaxID=77055 RepID=A0AAV1S272_9ROSI|nr:unnamed protein product [Dovyalis caffra]
MELKSSITTAFLLFLLLVTPYISRGGSDVADSEVYEIDYRGPETHSSVTPPPGHSHGRPWIHQDTVKTSHTPQGFRGGNNGEQVRPSIIPKNEELKMKVRLRQSNEEVDKMAQEAYGQQSQGEEEIREEKFYQRKNDFEAEIFYDSNFFVDQNQLPNLIKVIPQDIYRIHFGTLVFLLNGRNDINSLKDRLQAHPILSDPNRVLSLGYHSFMTIYE